jgi:hypothetical protein
MAAMLAQERVEFVKIASAVVVHNGTVRRRPSILGR